MFNLRIFAVLFATVLLVSCAQPKPLVQLTLLVENADRSDVFLGQVLGKPNDRGSLRMTSRTGVQCEGIYFLASQEYGEAAVRCDDGRRGLFRFVSTGTIVRGTGQLDDEPFKVSAADNRLIELCTRDPNCRP